MVLQLTPDASERCHLIACDGLLAHKDDVEMLVVINQVMNVIRQANDEATIGIEGPAAVSQYHQVALHNENQSDQYVQILSTADVAACINIAIAPLHIAFNDTQVLALIHRVLLAIVQNDNSEANQQSPMVNCCFYPLIPIAC